jgi:hypothetical protein
MTKEMWSAWHACKSFRESPEAWTQVRVQSPQGGWAEFVHPNHDLKIREQMSGAVDALAIDYEVDMVKTRRRIEDALRKTNKKSLLLKIAVELGCRIF